MAHQFWQFDTVHSSISFSIRHLIIAKARGRFGKWSGTLTLDEERPDESRVDIEIDAASIDTNEPQRDAHLRSADFFDVERFPTITFKSRRVQQNGDRLRITGDLTLHGVTREVTFDAEYAGEIKDPWGNDRRGFSAKTAIDRKDFGLTFNQVLDAGGLALGDRVDIGVEIEVFKPALAVAS